MTRISDLNRNQGLTDGDVFPIGAADGSTRGITAADAAKYFSAKTEEDIAPLIDEATQAAYNATQAAIDASQSAQNASQSTRDIMGNVGGSMASSPSWDSIPLYLDQEIGGQGGNLNKQGQALKNRIDVVRMASRTFQTRSEFVSAVASGEFSSYAHGSMVSADGITYYLKTGSNEIIDLPGWEPFGEKQFAHYGGIKSSGEQTRATVEHKRTVNGFVVDLTRVINPKPGVISQLTHPNMLPNGHSPRLRLDEFSKKYNSIALLNSNAFYTEGNPSDADGPIVQPNGIFIANRIAYSGWSTSSSALRDQALLCLRDGRMVKRVRGSGGDAASYASEGAEFAFSFGAWVVYEGVAQAVPSASFGTVKSARTIIGQASNGDYLFATVEGVTGAYGPTPQECGDLALSLGFERAFFCDGGGSTQLYWGGSYATPSSDVVFSVARTLPSCIGIFCPTGDYDSGWIDLPLSAGITANSSVGVKLRQFSNNVQLRIAVNGTFTTTPQAILATPGRDQAQQELPARYRPDGGTVVARGFLSGSGGFPAMTYAGTNMSVRTLTDPTYTGYLAGTVEWAAKNGGSSV